MIALPQAWGDVTLARKDVPTSYHLSVVIDDALQGVTDVVRGQDLFWSTSVHRLLQALLDLPAPAYRHHRLMLDADGRKALEIHAGRGRCGRSGPRGGHRRMFERWWVWRKGEWLPSWARGRLAPNHGGEATKTDNGEAEPQGAARTFACPQRTSSDRKCAGCPRS